MKSREKEQFDNVQIEIIRISSADVISTSGDTETEEIEEP